MKCKCGYEQTSTVESVWLWRVPGLTKQKRKEKQNAILDRMLEKVCDIQRSRKTQGILDVCSVQYADCLRDSDY